jgi:hypothetical protein
MNINSHLPGEIWNEECQHPSEYLVRGKETGLQNLINLSEGSEKDFIEFLLE